MKEVKAYVRKERAEDVVHALEGAGVGGVSVVECLSMAGPGGDDRRFSVEYAERVRDAVRVEVVAPDEDAPRLVEVISRAAGTGEAGDGLVWVTDVERAVRIRTGEEVQGG